MKNFYEATVTRPNLNLELALRVKPVGKVESQIQINDAVWTKEISSEEVFSHTVSLTAPIYIQIQISRQHPEALEIGLTVDGYEILPLYQERAGVTTCYLDHNDVWELNIANFYSWLHETTGQGWII